MPEPMVSSVLPRFQPGDISVSTFAADRLPAMPEEDDEDEDEEADDVELDELLALPEPPPGGGVTTPPPLPPPPPPPQLASTMTVATLSASALMWCADLSLLRICILSSPVWRIFRLIVIVQTIFRVYLAFAVSAYIPMTAPTNP